MTLEPRRNARAILIDDDVTSGGLGRTLLQDRGYDVTLVRDPAAAAAAARSTPTAVIFIQAPSAPAEVAQLIQGLKRDDATRHLPTHVLGLASHRPAPKGLNSVARTNW